MIGLDGGAVEEVTLRTTTLENAKLLVKECTAKEKIEKAKHERLKKRLTIAC